MAVDFEKFLKELVTTKEQLKILQKNFKKLADETELGELKKELNRVESKIEELNKTLQSWYSPGELEKKISKLKTELEVTKKLLDSVEQSLGYINQNLYLKPKKYSFLMLTAAFLSGGLIGISLILLLLKDKLNPVVNLNGILLEKNGTNCVKIPEGKVYIKIKNKSYEFSAKKLRLKICGEEK